MFIFYDVRAVQNMPYVSLAMFVFQNITLRKSNLFSIFEIQGQACFWWIPNFQIVSCFVRQLVFSYLLNKEVRRIGEWSTKTGFKPEWIWNSPCFFVRIKYSFSYLKHFCPCLVQSSLGKRSILESLYLTENIKIVYYSIGFTKSTIKPIVEKKFKTCFIFYATV